MIAPLIETPLTANIRPGREPLNLREYEQAGGYQALRKALSMRAEDIQRMVAAANLKGRGGAGFPTGRKWSFVPMGESAPRPRYLLVNADEMEPGTFKDRLLLEGDPHEMIESAVVSAYAIGAETIYIFLRWAYKLAARRLAAAIAEAYERHYLGRHILGTPYSVELRLHVSAGRYMCGEETGLINALEGRRASPRGKPPYPQIVGLWGKPTVVNNVETICNVHHIVGGGAEWFRKLSYTDEGGTKLYGVSGRVKRPGLWELPMGTTMREILDKHAGGMRDGYRLRGVIPGGASTDLLSADYLDTPMDFGSMEKTGSRLGTGTMIVLDDRTCPVGMVHNLMMFFARESCGWCTPCREGLPWITKILEALEAGQGRAGDVELLEDFPRWLGPGNTFCALAPGAVEPLAGALRFFREDFQKHVSMGRCPFR